MKKMMYSIILREFQRKNVVNKIDRIKCMGTKTKWPLQKQKRITQYETRKTTRRNRHFELHVTMSLYF